MLGPFEWFANPYNYQGMSLAYGIAVLAAFGAHTLAGATWSTVATGVSLALMFTTVVNPLLSIYYELPWPWWLVVGLSTGATSIMIMRSITKAAIRIFNRVDPIVDGGINRILPGAIKEDTKP